MLVFRDVFIPNKHIFMDGEVNLAATLVGASHVIAGAAAKPALATD